MLHDKITTLIRDSINTKESLLKDKLILEEIDACVSLLVSTFRNGNKVYFCGNGGSAADAQHLAAELSGRFYLDRDALPAEALHVNSSYMTAVANDYSYDVVYSRLVNGFGNKGDVLIGLSTSGNSRNIVKAIEAAKEKEMITIGLTGRSGGYMLDLCDHILRVPSDITPRIQESHILLGHIICQLVEEQYFGSTEQMMPSATL
jgi:D-sedoheptulose 7-phosphate isomerase